MAARTPSSVRLARTAADAALASAKAHTMRIMPNSASDLRSTAVRLATATPLRVQSSRTSRAGRPNLPACRLTVTGDGDEPRVTSTCSPVRAVIAVATAWTLALDSGSIPVTPATRTLMALIGWSGCVPVKATGFVNAGRSARLINTRGGCWG